MQWLTRCDGHRRKRPASAKEQAKRVYGAEYYRPDIDGLRGIAVLAVIGFHAFPDYFPGGYIGVDVFFVISGFLITSIILRQQRGGTFTFSGFYARRIRRIFPALLIVLAACLLLGGLVLLPDELEELGKHVGSAAGFLSNFTLWREAGYFSRAADLKPLLHLWSLGIEEQFYLIWPLLLMLLVKWHRNIVASVLLLTVASFLLGVAVGHLRQMAGFYLPFFRFWELGLGGLLAVAHEFPESAKRWLDVDVPGSRFRPVASHVYSTLPIIGMGLIGAAIFLFDRDTVFPGWAALVPTVGAMCVIGGRGDSGFQRRIMACAGLVFVGLISYPLYLWHWPLLSFATILESGTPESAVRTAAVLLSFVLAWMTFRWFEVPIRARRSGHAVVALAGGLVVIGAAGLGIYAAKGFPHRFEFDVVAIRPAPRTNPLCVRNFSEDMDFNYCKSTSPARPAAVFLGDSRAQGVYDGVAALVGRKHPLMLLGRGGCPPMLNVRVAETLEQGCNEAWNTFVGYVREAKPPAVVIVGGGSELVRGDAHAWQPEDGRFQTRGEAFKQGLRNLIAALRQTSRVIYVRQIPPFSTAPECFLRPVKLPWSQCAPRVSRGAMEHAMRPYNRIIDELQAEIPGLHVVDSMTVLCDEKACSQKLRSGEIIYSDQFHLSPAGSLYFARRSALPGIIIAEGTGRDT